MLTDAQLISRSREAPERFAELFDRHYDRIAGYLRRRLDSTVADDLVAETFLQAFESRGRYDLTRPDAAPWLYGIATNLLRRHYRKEGRRWKAYAAHAARDVVAPGSPDAEARMDAAAAGPDLGRALARLRRDDRDALLLLVWADLGYAEIAHALDVPIGTVRSRINRARRILAADLGALAPSDITPAPVEPALPLAPTGLVPSASKASE